MKILFGEKKGKCGYLAGAHLKARFSGKYLQHICSKKLSFLLQWNLAKLILKWDDIFEQKIFKEKSN